MHFGLQWHGIAINQCYEAADVEEDFCTIFTHTITKQTIVMIVNDDLYRQYTHTYVKDGCVMYTLQCLMVKL